jgi:ABC-type branched-subunit amino acid transport system substrate-binding protein
MRVVRGRFGVLMLVLVALAVSPLVLVASSAGAAGRVRGFDGSTITVAGYGIKQLLPGAEWGARARIQQFNDNNEIKGVKINFVEFTDDKEDPATALSEVRRLVSQDQVFALVPEISLNTPGDYINQQRVPTFGGGFTAPYCSTKPSTSLWLFGFNGCQVTPKPSVTDDTEGKEGVLKYVQQQTGHQHPTVVFMTQDNSVGKIAAKLFKVQYVHDGYKLVGSVQDFPPPPVADVSPYVQRILTADHGKPPDFVRCSVGTDCLNVYTQLRAGGFNGIFEHDLYTDSLVKPFKGTISAIPFANIDTPGDPNVAKLKAAVAKVKPDYKIDSGVMYGYLSTDMFISALKIAAKKGKSNITPEGVQKAAATQTWQIKGLAGPMKYPVATVHPVPLCREIVASDGTTWKTVEPYTCNTRAYKAS